MGARNTLTMGPGLGQGNQNEYSEYYRVSEYTHECLPVLLMAIQHLLLYLDEESSISTQLASLIAFLKLNLRVFWKNPSVRFGSIADI